MGCIPVTFSNVTASFAPWHWRDWHAAGHIPISRLDFLHGKVDLKQLLQSIPSDVHNRVKRAISRYGGRFQYSLDDRDHDDAMHVLLRALATDGKRICEECLR